MAKYKWIREKSSRLHEEDWLLVNKATSEAVGHVYFDGCLDYFAYTKRKTQPHSTWGVIGCTNSLLKAKRLVTKYIKEKYGTTSS